MTDDSDNFRNHPLDRSAGIAAGAAYKLFQHKENTNGFE